MKNVYNKNLKICKIVLFSYFRSFAIVITLLNKKKDKSLLLEMSDSTYGHLGEDLIIRPPIIFLASKFNINYFVFIILYVVFTKYEQIK